MGTFPHAKRLRTRHRILKLENKVGVSSCALWRWRVAGHATLVAFGVAKVGPVVVGVVVGAQSRWAFTGTAVVQRRLVGLAHRRTVGGQKGRHLSIARMVRLPIVRLADDEQRAGAVGAVPAGPGVLAFTKPLANAQALHQGRIKGIGPIKVTDTHKHM